jgi:hypothetical protein
MPEWQRETPIKCIYNIPIKFLWYTSTQVKKGNNEIG